MAEVAKDVVAKEAGANVVAKDAAANVAKEVTPAKEVAPAKEIAPTKEGTPAKEDKDPAKSIDENEIRVTAQGKMRNYVTYAAALFTDKKQTLVVLKGMGRVINKTVSLAEILKRRVKGLYQLTEIGSVEVTDTVPAEEEGQEPEGTTRMLSVISIILTTEPTDDPRYQTPLPDEEIEPLKKLPPRRGRGRGANTRRPAKGEEGGGAEGEYAAGSHHRGGRGGRGARGHGGRGGRGRGRKPAASKTEDEQVAAPAKEAATA